MTRKTYPPEEISAKLKRAEELITGGATVAEAAQFVGVKYGTLYQWRRRFADAAATDGIRRIKQLEAENARLRKALDELDRPVVVFRQREASSA